jgi:hypothetical protein
MSHKSSASSILCEGGVSFQIELANLAVKKPQPLCEIWIEKGIGEKGKICDH